MHQRIAFLYKDNCCTEKNHVQLKIKGKFKRLLKTVEKAFKKLHKNKKYNYNDILEVEEFKKVVDDTTEIFNLAIEGETLPEELTEKFKKDVFVFSGLKTHAQLLEASKLLFTKDNIFKSFEVFSHDIAGIKENYNEHYLEAEHNYAVGTMQNVDRWQSFSNSDRYYLQYRTAGDAKVRETHKALDNITLPKNSEFWDSYFPKNGWRCRCTVVEVLKDNANVSDEKKAIENAKIATTQISKNGKNKLEIFRYNPAKKGVIFPPDHPYQKTINANPLAKKLKDEF